MRARCRLAKGGQGTGFGNSWCTRRGCTPMALCIGFRGRRNKPGRYPGQLAQWVCTTARWCTGNSTRFATQALQARCTRGRLDIVAPGCTDTAGLSSCTRLVGSLKSSGHRCSSVSSPSAACNQFPRHVLWDLGAVECTRGAGALDVDPQHERWLQPGCSI